MKTLSIILLLVLIPLALMSSFLSNKSALTNSFITAPTTTDRTWRLNSVLQEGNYLEVWHESAHYEYIYSQQYPTRLDTLIYLTWDTGVQNWMPFFVSSYTYDITNEYITGTYTKTFLGGMETPMSRGTNTFDNQHRITFALWESYNMGSQSWVTSRWTKIIYRSNTDYDVFNYSIGEESRPPEWSRLILTHDSQGRITQELELVSADSVNWTNSTKLIRTFHPNDTTTGDIFVQNIAHWLPLQGFMPTFSTESAFGMATQELNQNYETDSWVDVELDLYTYDTSDRLIQFIEQDWQAAWVNYQKREMSYNVNGNLFQWTEYDWLSNAWEPRTRYTLTWGQDIANDDNISPPLSGLIISASPNPFNSEVSLRVTCKSTQPVVLSIYNSKGQLIKTLNAKTNSTVSWDGKDNKQKSVSNGIYFIIANAEGISKTTKILKVK